MVIIAAGLFLTLILPYLYYRPAYIERILGSETDAVSGATIVLPAQPSGHFLVLLNSELHPDTLSAWRDFFEEKEVGVIMEDLSCLTVAGDAGGNALAKRYQARLAANQMKLRTEEGLLVASRAESGVYDVVIVSEEMADALYLRTDADDSRMYVISIEGEESE